MTNPVTDHPDAPSAPRVLIVEDEMTLAHTFAGVVEQLNAKPIICRSGSRARAELSQQPASVIIMDIGLPDVNALSLLPFCRGAKVLVVTAQGNLEHAVAATKFGASAYLVKPVDLDQMHVLLQELIATAPALPATNSLPVPATPMIVRPLEVKKAVRPAPVKSSPPPPQRAASSETSDQMRNALTVWLREQVAAGLTYDKIMDRIEEHVLRELLCQYNNRSTHLARALDINRVTLLKRRKLFKIDA